MGKGERGREEGKGGEIGKRGMEREGNILDPLDQKTWGRL